LGVSEAEPLGLVVARIAGEADAKNVRDLTCAGRRPRFAETAQKVIRRCGRALAGNLDPGAGFRCLLFEVANQADAMELVAVSALRDAPAEATADWIVMGIAKPFQGRRLEDGRSLAVAIAEETMRHAGAAGYRRVVAMVHRDHATSLHILKRLEFTDAGELGDDYLLLAADVA
jgi:hypothetical protein